MSQESGRAGLPVSQNAQERRWRRRRAPLAIYTPNFVELPNKFALFDAFFELVYTFTFLYTKNVREALIHSP